jgi:hypothetical protein
MPFDVVEGGDPPNPQTGGGGSPSTVFEIVVNGQVERFDLSNPQERDALKARAQMGTNYSQKVEQLNRKELEREAAHKPYMQFDEHLKSDPALEALVVARLRGDPLPLHLFKGVKPAPGTNGVDDDNGGDGDHRDVGALRDELRGEFRGQTGRLAQLLTRMEERMNQRDLMEAQREDEQRIKSHHIFKGWVRDDHITLAKEAMRQRGGGLYENFVLLFEKEIPAIIESRYEERIPANLRRTALDRASAPLVVDGQTLSEERLAEIRRDPDQLQKYRKVLREHRRRLTGKIELPR